MAWMRRKTLADYYDMSLRMVDYILADMRSQADCEKNIIADGRLTIINQEAFENALRHRKRRA